MNSLLEEHVEGLAGKLKTDFASLEAKMDKVHKTFADICNFVTRRGIDRKKQGNGNLVPNLNCCQI